MRQALIVAFAVLALSACNRSPTSAAPRTWAHDVATTYYETRGDGAAIARMSQAQEVETALGGLSGALGEQRTARIGAERIGFLLQYPPIWRADHIDQAQWEARRARIPLIPDADLGQWRAALADASGTQPSEMWTIGYLIDTPSLFKDNAFDAQRSSVLLERLAKLSPEAIGLVASPLHMDRAWAALLIVQNDTMFHGTDIDADKFASAVSALDEATSPQPSANQATTQAPSPATTQETKS